MSDQGERRGRRADTRKPAFHAYAESNGNLPGRRIMFVFRSIGCAYARRVGPCVGCAFPFGSTFGEPVPAEHLIEQFDAVFGQLDLEAEDVTEVDLYNSGSFFNDEEIPPEVRRHVYAWARDQPFLQELLIEARAEDVTEEKVRAMREGVPGKLLTVGVGLESADDHIRLDVLRKGLPKDVFERALDTMAAHRVGLLAYMLFKPAGIGEKLAIEDAERTAAYVFGESRRRNMRAVAALQPAFVQKGTEFHRLYRAGEYRPPWIWSVVEAVRRMVAKGGEVSIGTSQDDPPPYAHRENCGVCDARVEEAIEEFNRHLRIEALEGLACGCQDEWRAALEQSDPVPRVIPRRDFPTSDAGEPAP